MPATCAEQQGRREASGLLLAHDWSKKDSTHGVRQFVKCGRASDEESGEGRGQKIVVRTADRSLQREHAESASETHPHLQFFVDLTNFSSEFAFGPMFIRFLLKFSISLTWRVFLCNCRGSGKKLRCVQKFCPYLAPATYVAAA